MKTLFAVLLLLFAGLAQAEESKIVNGEIMLVPSNLIATGVKVTPEAEMYPQAVGKAFANPGKPVGVEHKYVYKMVDIFRYRKETVSTLEVQYDPLKATIGAVVSNSVVGVEMVFSSFFILWIFSIVAFFVVTEMKNIFAAVVVPLAALAGASLIIIIYPVVSIASTFAIFLSYIFVVVTVGKVFHEEEVPKAVKTGFYILMLLGAGLRYHPLFI